MTRGAFELLESLFMPVFMARRARGPRGPFLALMALFATNFLMAPSQRKLGVAMTEDDSLESAQWAVAILTLPSLVALVVFVAVA